MNNYEHIKQMDDEDFEKWIIDHMHIRYAKGLSIFEFSNFLCRTINCKYCFLNKKNDCRAMFTDVGCMCKFEKWLKDEYKEKDFEEE